MILIYGFVVSDSKFHMEVFILFMLNPDINECASNPCAYGDCDDRVDEYICYCFGGWEGPNCDQGILVS